MDLQQLYNQARQAQKNGNLAEAARLYSQILSASSVPEVMVNYGNVLAQLGNRPEALAQYDQALKLKKNFFRRWKFAKFWSGSSLSRPIKIRTAPHGS